MKIFNSSFIANISSTIRTHLPILQKNIRPHPSPNLDVTSHHRVFQKDGIGLSQTGKSTQLVIMSHGGWKEISHPQTLFTRQKGDGWTVVPQNLRLDFYTKDNDFTKGLSVLSEVNKRHTEAQTGLTLSLNISQDDLSFLANARNIPQSKLEEEMKSQAIYRKEYAISNEKIKNYALYYHDQAKNIIQKH
ncbi:putative adhesin, partial [Escherichia coli]